MNFNATITQYLNVPKIIKYVFFFFKNIILSLSDF